ncbi:hypothetical protein [Pararhodonellum marinum]|uniref:hypothetical protein n=1 Tax=Pararhodonellum marinum TaxID=2755358 RepID=UPI00188FAD83|nr:hypothetical protein [Pararhodonellum marinum]
MTKSFTQNDLIRYIYQEMNDGESDNLVQALRENSSLMQDYLDMLSTIEHINQIILHPSEKVVRAIKKRFKSTGLQSVS